MGNILFLFIYGFVFGKVRIPISNSNTRQQAFLTKNFHDFRKPL
jgi:hypothetical protein